MDEGYIESSQASFDYSPIRSLNDSRKLTLTQSNSEPTQEDRPPRFYRHLQTKFGILRSVQEIPSAYRPLFKKILYFNPVQSAILDDALYTESNLVVSAPTASGKTTIFELAILELIMTIKDLNYTGDFKIVYIAPIKALCTERLCDWNERFSDINISCIEVTGDTDRLEFKNLQMYNIIITTPEKWDSITRRWKEHKHIVQVVKLFMVDEIHLLGDKKRGPTVEAIVNRMKIIQKTTELELRAQNQSKEFNLTHLNFLTRVRFIATSATITNIEDLAEWLSSKQGTPAVIKKFSEDVRPVKLKKIVYGYSSGANTTPYKFDMSLNYKLPGIISQHSNNKPTLIFCTTRKGIPPTARKLAESLSFRFSETQQQNIKDRTAELNDPELRSLVTLGFGWHHAGMTSEDRFIIEQLFSTGSLPVLLTTSTLAMGVNLPAHLVIIKSTEMYQNGATELYNGISIQQMIGRAGRPQFDTEATAVILTRENTKKYYENMMMGTELIESNLHKLLGEHLNAEIVLRTITDLTVAMDWIRMTFLYVRCLKNPKYYGFQTEWTKDKIENTLIELCQIEINKLAKFELVNIDSEFGIDLTPTRKGELMAYYYISFPTMKLMVKLNGTESVFQLLNIVANSEEVNELRLRVSDKRSLNKLNDGKTPSLRYPLPGKIKTSAMKVNCIIQAIFGLLPMEPSMKVESEMIIRIGKRVSHCLYEYLKDKTNMHTSLRSAVILSKCFTVKLWENTPFVAKQLPRIGDVGANALVEAGKTSFSEIMNTNPRELERILNRKPPAGNNIIDFVKSLPRHSVNIVIPDIAAAPPRFVTITIQLVNPVESSSFGLQSGSMTLLVGDSDNNVLCCKQFNSTQRTETLRENWVYLDSFNFFSVAQLMLEGSTTETIQLMLENEHEIYVDLIKQHWVGLDVNLTRKIPPVSQYLIKNLHQIVEPSKQTNHQAPKVSMVTPRKPNGIMKPLSHYFPKPVTITTNDNPAVTEAVIDKELSDHHFSHDIVDSTIKTVDDQEKKIGSSPAPKETCNFPPELGFNWDDLDDPFWDQSTQTVPVNRNPIEEAHSLEQNEEDKEPESNNCHSDYSIKCFELKDNTSVKNTPAGTTPSHKITKKIPENNYINKKFVPQEYQGNNFEAQFSKSLVEFNKFDDFPRTTNMDSWDPTPQPESTIISENVISSTNQSLSDIKQTPSSSSGYGTAFTDPESWNAIPNIWNSLPPNSEDLLPTAQFPKNNLSKTPSKYQMLNLKHLQVNEPYTFSKNPSTITTKTRIQTPSLVNLGQSNQPDLIYPSWNKLVQNYPEELCTQAKPKVSTDDGKQSDIPSPSEKTTNQIDRSRNIFKNSEPTNFFTFNEIKNDNNNQSFSTIGNPKLAKPKGTEETESRNNIFNNLWNQKESSPIIPKKNKTVDQCVQTSQKLISNLKPSIIRPNKVITGARINLSSEPLQQTHIYQNHLKANTSSDSESSPTYTHKKFRKSSTSNPKLARFALSPKKQLPVVPKETPMKAVTWRSPLTSEHALSTPSSDSSTPIPFKKSRSQKPNEVFETGIIRSPYPKQSSSYSDSDQSPIYENIYLKKQKYEVKEILVKKQYVSKKSGEDGSVKIKEFINHSLSQKENTQYFLQTFGKGTKPATKSKTYDSRKHLSPAIQQTLHSFSNRGAGDKDTFNSSETTKKNTNFNQFNQKIEDFVNTANRHVRVGRLTRENLETSRLNPNGNPSNFVQSDVGYQTRDYKIPRREEVFRDEEYSIPRTVSKYNIDPNFARPIFQNTSSLQEPPNYDYGAYREIAKPHNQSAMSNYLDYVEPTTTVIPQFHSNQTRDYNVMRPEITTDVAESSLVCRRPNRIPLSDIHFPGKESNNSELFMPTENLKLTTSYPRPSTCMGAQQIAKPYQIELEQNFNEEPSIYDLSPKSFMSALWR